MSRAEGSEEPGLSKPFLRPGILLLRNTRCLIMPSVYVDQEEALPI